MEALSAGVEPAIPSSARDLAIVGASVARPGVEPGPLAVLSRFPLPIGVASHFNKVAHSGFEPELRRLWTVSHCRWGSEPW
jgi:hypothetical protein